MQESPENFEDVIKEVAYKIRNKDIERFARVSKGLGLDGETVEDITDDYGGKAYEKKLKLLRKWKTLHPEATPDMLRSIVENFNIPDEGEDGAAGYRPSFLEADNAATYSIAGGNFAHATFGEQTTSSPIGEQEMSFALQEFEPDAAIQAVSVKQGGSGVSISGGSFSDVHIGPKKDVKIFKGYRVENANIMHHHQHHHHHYHGSIAPITAAGAAGTSTASIEEEIDDDTAESAGIPILQVGHDIYIDRSRPLRPGYQVYAGEQRLEGGVKNRDLAVKIYHIEGEFSLPKDSKSSLYRRYHNDVNNMAKLHPHPNVVQFIHCGKVLQSKLGGFYIAMRLYHQNTLADIDLDSLTPEHRLTLFLQICHGVKHLHTDSKPVAHRDLKPSNILFSLDGKNAVVSDFGLSKEVDIKRVASKTIIKSSSTSFGGTWGWAPAEMLRKKGTGQPDFLKADIFSLALVGSFILCSKHHPFVDADDPDDSALMHAKIKKGHDPDLTPVESLSDGHIVADLFEKMLSHTPQSRPDIAYVLQHCTFWDCCKKMDFFRDVHERYFKSGKLQKDGTEEQKSAFHPVLLGSRKESQEFKMDMDDSPALGDGITTASASGTSKSPSSDVLSPICDDLDSNTVSSDASGFPIPFASVAFSSDSSASSSSADSQMSFEESEEDIERGKIFAKMREIFSECWLERVRSDPDFQTIDKEQKDEDAYDNSLKDLIRFIRNYHIYRVGEDEQRIAIAAWRFFSRLFPKLLPYLYNIMEPALLRGHCEKYKLCIAKPDDIDFNDVLAKNP